MFNSPAHVLARGAVGSELVGDHDARRSCRLLLKFADEPPCHGSISSTLNQNVENKAVLVDGAPAPMLLATDRDDDLVNMPFVVTSWSAATNWIGEFPAEFLSPVANAVS
jgi:hypothetical protein